MNFEIMIEALKQNDTYLIYGAGVIAYEIMTAVKELYNKKPRFFLVTNRNECRDAICNVDVITPNEILINEWKLPILVATPEIYHGQICQEIQRFSSGKSEKVFYIDSDMEYRFMSRYFKKMGSIVLLEQLEDENVNNKKTASDNLSVYMAKSHKDSPLKNKYDIPSWIVPVQAGADCTDASMDIITDNTGQNISWKNPNYCELTVTYWAWKNQSNLYKGICHYRRMLVLSESDIYKCIKNDVDVILPLPFVCYPNATGQYKRYISENDINGLKNALYHIAPEYLSVWDKVDNESYFYNYNMFIAKENVFNEYSEWIFNVLKYAEKYCEPLYKKRQDRYAGYLGELLTTLYFVGNKEKLKIVHAKKIWMV